jgi:hypothetical protein
MRCWTDPRLSQYDRFVLEVLNSRSLNLDEKDPECWAEMIRWGREFAEAQLRVNTKKPKEINSGSKRPVSKKR